MAEKKARRNAAARKATEKQTVKEMVARAKRALDDLHDRNQPITFVSVSEAADVSRSWLYKHTEIRARIERKRKEQKSKRLRSRPGRKKGMRGIGSFDAENEEFTIRIPRATRPSKKTAGEEDTDFLKLIWREDALVLIIKHHPGGT